MGGITEGKAILNLPPTSLGSGRVVFYNPKMSLNRDLSVLFVTSYFPEWRNLRLCDLMTGSGVRAIRYVLECLNVESVTAIDVDAEAVEVANENVQLNRLEGRVTVLQSEAKAFLAENSQRFDMIDVDPYGPPVRFLESCAYSTHDGGVIAITATDMGPLTGAKPVSCLRKYGVWTARTEFGKELAIRTLASTLAREACKFDLGVEVVFAHVSDHYARFYARVTVGKTASNEAMALLGFVEYCNLCLSRKSKTSLNGLSSTCENCSAKTTRMGPVWLGPLWDELIVRRMVQQAAALSSSRLSEVQTLLSRIEAEIQGPPFHYTTDCLASNLEINPPKLESLLSSLKDAGFIATRTHFAPNGFRTDATPSEISSVLPSLAVKAQAQ